MKVFTTLLILFILSSLIISSCAKQSEGRVMIENPEVEIRQLWDRFIQNWKAGDAEASVAIYHADALNIPNNFKINNGQGEIREFYSFLFENNQPIDYRHRTESIHFKEDLAVEYATFYADWTSNEGEEWSYEARTLIHWKKDPEAGWRIKAMLFNNPPEEVPQP